MKTRDMSVAAFSPTTSSASTRLLSLLMSVSICLSRTLLSMAEPAALRSRETTAIKVSPKGGTPRLARTIPAKPVKATLSIMPGFESRIVETTILAGALSMCPIVFIPFCSPRIVY